MNLVEISKQYIKAQTKMVVEPIYYLVSCTIISELNSIALR